MHEPAPASAPPLPCDGCVILILAAGRGTRMGGPKALMPVSGAPWWVHQRRRLSALGGEVRWIVSGEVDAGLRASSDEELVQGRVVVDSAAPMFHSVLAGLLSIGESRLGSLRGGGVFVLPIDVPAPAARTWRVLRGDDADSSSRRAPCVPTWEGKRGHPVFLPASWVTGTLFPRLPDLSGWRPGEHDAAVHELLAPFRLDELLAPDRALQPVADVGILLNLNTPADVAEWLRTSPLDAVE